LHPTSDDERVRALLAAARQSARRGQSFDAERLLRQAEAEAPRHPLVLVKIAARLLRDGKSAQAAGLLKDAAENDSTSPEVWFHYATALRDLGRPDEAIAALDRALELEPRMVRALLEKGTIQQLQGQRRAAAMSYKTALQMIPPTVKPPLELEPLLHEAQRAVEDNNRALEAYIEGCLQEIKARFPDEPLHRFEQCVDIMLQPRRIYPQQPTFMYYPELPAIEFYARQPFPWIETVEAAADDIRQELLAVFGERSELEPYVSLPKGVSMPEWQELNNSRRWSVYSLWNEGKAFPEHIARCPKTIAALQTVPLWDIPGYGPTALFSILDAKTRIPAHTGPTNTRLVVHLPLIVPPGCGFRVGGQTRAWNPGEAFVFDDSIDHEAWNDSDVPRAVLIFSIWKPYLSEAERELTRALTTSIGEYYGTRPDSRNAAEVSAPAPP